MMAWHGGTLALWLQEKPMARSQAMTKGQMQVGLPDSNTQYVRFLSVGFHFVLPNLQRAITLWLQPGEDVKHRSPLNTRTRNQSDPLIQR